MKKIGVIFLRGLVACLPIVTSGQSTIETALLFSSTTNTASARITGMGGVSTSLGGDVSSASTNPAGLGMFNHSEFAITPSYSGNTNYAKYFGTEVTDSRTNLSIPSLSIVFNSPINGGKWVSGTFALSRTRMNDFHSNTKYLGVNPNNSIADYFAYDSYGLDPDDLNYNYSSLNDLAFQTYLIDPVSYNASTNTYGYGAGFNLSAGNENAVPKSTQQEERIYSGTQDQWTASYGANYDDRFFFGASLNFRSINFQSKNIYQETGFTFTNAQPGFSSINSIYLEEHLKTTGSGISATIGGIARLVEGFQVGISFNTPTNYYRMNDVYRARLMANWPGNYDYYGDGSLLIGPQDVSSDQVESKYKLKTPGRVSMGATYFINKIGLVSLDADYIYYGNAKYSGNQYFEPDNKTISTLYKPSVNLRLGGEYRLKIYRFRAGFGVQTDPYADADHHVSRAVNTLSLGAGIRKEGYFVDVALVHGSSSNVYKPYSLPGSDSPWVKLTNRTTNFMVTIGRRIGN